MKFLLVLLQKEAPPHWDAVPSLSQELLSCMVATEVKNIRLSYRITHGMRVKLIPSRVPSLANLDNNNTPNDTTLQARVSAVLRDNGYTMTEMQQWLMMSSVNFGSAGMAQNGGSLMATDRNGNAQPISVVYNNYNTLTVDGIVREYMRYGAATTSTNADLVAWANGRGTGYLGASGVNPAESSFA